VIPYAEYQELAALREREHKQAWHAEQERLLRKEIAAFEQMMTGKIESNISPVASLFCWYAEMLGEIFRIRPMWSSPLWRMYRLLSRPFQWNAH